MPKAAAKKAEVPQPVTVTIDAHYRYWVSEAILESALRMEQMANGLRKGSVAKTLTWDRAGRMRQIADKIRR